MKLIRKIVIILLALAILSAIGVIAIYYDVNSVGKRMLGAGGYTADCIIVPGAGVVDGRPSLTLARRLDKAIEIYNESGIDRIIVSGDHGQKDYDEVNIMRDYLVASGIPKENIFMDHAGFSTYDTIYRAREVFLAESAVVVTQRLHLMRALYIADALGLECRGVVAGESTAGSRRVQEVREFPARVKAFLQCYVLKSKPKYLGEPIPVSGSGLVTEG